VPSSRQRCAVLLNEQRRRWEGARAQHAAKQSDEQQTGKQNKNKTERAFVARRRRGGSRTNAKREKTRQRRRREGEDGGQGEGHHAHSRARTRPAGRSQTHTIQQTERDSGGVGNSERGPNARGTHATGQTAADTDTHARETAPAAQRTAARAHARADVRQYDASHEMDGDGRIRLSQCECKANGMEWNGMGAERNQCGRTRNGSATADCDGDGVPLT
jgi:hypothetical protein